jgi:hypothetical protein
MILIRNSHDNSVGRSMTSIQRGEYAHEAIGLQNWRAPSNSQQEDTSRGR